VAAEASAGGRLGAMYRQSSVDPDMGTERQARRASYAVNRAASSCSERYQINLPARDMQPTVGLFTGGVSERRPSPLIGRITSPSGGNPQYGAVGNSCGYRPVSTQPQSGVSNKQRYSPVGKAASFSCESGGKYLLVRNGDQDLNTTGDNAAKRRDYSVAKASSLNEQACGNNDDVILKDASLLLARLRKQSHIDREVTVCSSGNQISVDQSDPAVIQISATDERRQNISMPRADSLQAEGSKVRLPIPTSTLSARRNSIGRASSLSSAASNSTGRSTGTSGNFLSVPLEIFGSRRPSTTSSHDSYPGEGVLRLAGQSPSVSPSPTPLSSIAHKNIPVGNNLLQQACEKNLVLAAHRRNSIMRASSLSSGACGKSDYHRLQGPDLVLRGARRPSVNRASSLSSGGQCGGYRPLLLDQKGLCQSSIVSPSNLVRSNDYLSKSHVSTSPHNVKFNNEGLE